MTWKNYDGTILKVDENVAEGTVPEYTGEAPVHPATEDYNYYFTGWGQISSVSGDVTY